MCYLIIKGHDNGVKILGLYENLEKIPVDFFRFLKKEHSKFQKNPSNFIYYLIKINKNILEISFALQGFVDKNKNSRVLITSLNDFNEFIEQLKQMVKKVKKQRQIITLMSKKRNTKVFEQGPSLNKIKQYHGV